MAAGRRQALSSRRVGHHSSPRRAAVPSRTCQALDADEPISVAVRAPALDVVQQALFERQVFGILEIPPDTEREVLKGNKARIPAYVDSGYSLVFKPHIAGDC
jgi:hypothetical protein